MPSTTTRLARSATMTQSKMISFAELIQGRDPSVRVTDNNELYMVDLTMAMHGSSRNYATQVQSHPCKMHLWESLAYACLNS